MEYLSMPSSTRRWRPSRSIGEPVRIFVGEALDHIADHPANRVDELLPWNVVLSLPPTAHVEPIR
ncbi:hypothetical protein [Burkholderia stabilis]|uniref:hypothetical protein n=1 Tax=Burkholderia stabilis TaxID=95485 RepID=UPI001010C939|nr:hypothetical protein [Burkholderia stabilis]